MPLQINQEAKKQNDSIFETPTCDLINAVDEVNFKLRQQNTLSSHDSVLMSSPEKVKRCVHNSSIEDNKATASMN